MKKRTAADIAALVTAIIFIVYMLIAASSTVWSNFLTEEDASSLPAFLAFGSYITVFGFLLIIPLFVFMLIYLSIKSARCSRAKSGAPFRYAYFPAIATTASLILFLLLGLLKHFN